MLDCTVYAEAIAYNPAISIQRKRDADWQNLERLLEPPTGDLFAQAPTVQTSALPQPPSETPLAATQPTDNWLDRHDTQDWIP